MKTQTEKDDRGRSQAKAQLESIIEMVKALREAIENDDDDAREEVEQTIHEDALSVETRSGWRSPGSKPEADSEFTILLCTGGPAVRIIGDLSEHAEPEKARLEYQDWGTPWTPYPLTSDEEGAVLEYCRTFYFGS